MSPRQCCRPWANGREAGFRGKLLLVFRAETNNSFPQNPQRPASTARLWTPPGSSRNSIPAGERQYVCGNSNEFSNLPLTPSPRRTTSTHSRNLSHILRITCIFVTYITHLMAHLHELS